MWGQLPHFNFNYPSCNVLITVYLLISLYLPVPVGVVKTINEESDFMFSNYFHYKLRAFTE